MIARRFALSLFQRHPLHFSRLKDLSILNLTDKYWAKKPSPLLCEAFYAISEYLDLIPPLPKPVRYELNYVSLRAPPISIPSNSVQNPTSFTKFIRERWPEAVHIYTDGSLIDGKVGSAYYDMTRNAIARFRLADFASIYTAELIALHEAFKYAMQLHLEPRPVIFLTDSLSVIAKLQNINPNSNLNYIEGEIVKLCAALRTSGRQFRLIWVKSHAGIVGNELVDSYAKEATKKPTCDIQTPVYPPSDLRRRLREEMLKEWQDTYDRYPSGEPYKTTFPKVSLTPWFTKCPGKSKSFYKTISRIRSGHCVTKAYLHRIGRSDTDLCDTCQTTETLHHIILECNKFNAQRDIMINSLPTSIPRPFNLATILRQDVYELIFIFLCSSNITI
ncbi:hypothetical protein GE061_000940 [Apolygus lucorum]|uniref:ribonuclease H n=1 Tax=Apolygus lucorum TaxID=248454 RepID=A0A8S9Y5Q8_APOLU|nr:hypothetical protein GE061_000940 [Apolygus lucorum]